MSCKYTLLTSHGVNVSVFFSKAGIPEGFVMGCSVREKRPGPAWMGEHEAVCARSPGAAARLLQGPSGSGSKGSSLQGLPAVESHVRSGKIGCPSENRTVWLKAGERLKR